MWGPPGGMAAWSAARCRSAHRLMLSIWCSGSHRGKVARNALELAAVIFFWWGIAAPGRRGNFGRRAVAIPAPIVLVAAALGARPGELRRQGPRAQEDWRPSFRGRMRRRLRALARGVDEERPVCGVREHERLARYE